MLLFCCIAATACCLYRNEVPRPRTGELVVSFLRAAFDDRAHLGRLARFTGITTAIATGIDTTLGRAVERFGHLTLPTKNSL